MAIYGAPSVSWCKNNLEWSKMGMTKFAVDAKIHCVNIKIQIIYDIHITEMLLAISNSLKSLLTTYHRCQHFLFRIKLSNLTAV